MKQLKEDARQKMQWHCSELVKADAVNIGNKKVMPQAGMTLRIAQTLAAYARVRNIGLVPAGFGRTRPG